MYVLGLALGTRYGWCLLRACFDADPDDDNESDAIWAASLAHDTYAPREA